jgi:cyclopropane fatty-acyl-phospholipid synthase-like methyltransferase
MNAASRPTIGENLRVLFRLCRILTHFSRTRSDLVYQALSDRHVMGDGSLYINLGYWENAGTLDEASAALATLLAKEAGFAAGDRVLDCGFGFADQDIQWAREFPGVHITGINISSLQVGRAEQRVRDAGLIDKIDLREGDATAMPFEDGTFHKVVALESAFHFPSRKRFLQEAHRVLRPGGRIALADFADAPEASRRGLRQRVARFAGVSSWQIPPQNLISREQYAEDMRACGFHHVEVKSIGHHVFAPFEAYQRARFDSPEFQHRYHPVVRRMAKFQIDWGFLRTLDYVIATGEKEPTSVESRGDSQAASPPARSAYCQ